MSTVNEPATTKEKIEFGGLVIIAGLTKYDKDTILGIMIDALEKFEQSTLDKRESLKKLGKARIIQRSREKKDQKHRLPPVLPKDNTVGEIDSCRLI